MGFWVDWFGDTPRNRATDEWDDQRWARIEEKRKKKDEQMPGV